MNMPGANPLFAQDRIFLNPYSQATTSQTLPQLGFTPINGGRERHRTMQSNRTAGAPENIKTELHICDRREVTESPTGHSSRLPIKDLDLWDSQGHKNGLDLEEETHSGQIEM